MSCQRSHLCLLLGVEGAYPQHQIHEAGAEGYCLQAHEQMPAFDRSVRRSPSNLYLSSLIFVLVVARRVALRNSLPYSQATPPQLHLTAAAYYSALSAGF